MTAVLRLQRPLWQRPEQESQRQLAPLPKLAQGPRPRQTSRAKEQTSKEMRGQDKKSLGAVQTAQKTGALLERRFILYCKKQLQEYNASYKNIKYRQ